MKGTKMKTEIKGNGFDIYIRSNSDGSFTLTIFDTEADIKESSGHYKECDNRTFYLHNFPLGGINDPDFLDWANINKLG
jgi:hypothetical protein